MLWWKFIHAMKTHHTKLFISIRWGVLLNFVLLSLAILNHWLNFPSVGEVKYGIKTISAQMKRNLDLSLAKLIDMCLLINIVNFDLISLDKFIRWQIPASFWHRFVCCGMLDYLSFFYDYDSFKYSFDLFFCNLVQGQNNK